LRTAALCELDRQQQPSPRSVTVNRLQDPPHAFYENLDTASIYSAVPLTRTGLVPAACDQAGMKATSNTNRYNKSLGKP